MMRFDVSDSINKTVILLIDLNDPFLSLGKISVIIFAIPCDNSTPLAVGSHAAFDLSGLASSFIF